MWIKRATWGRGLQTCEAAIERKRTKKRKVDWNENEAKGKETRLDLVVKIVTKKLSALKQLTP